MTDNDLPGPDELGTGFEKHVEESIAPRGSTTLREEHRRIDPATGKLEVEKVEHATCDCGVSRDATEYVFTCVSCDGTSCPLCSIRIGREQYCPTCVKTGYSLDKRVFVTLLYIAKDVLEPDDLTAIETVVDQPIEVTIDRSLGTLVDHDYIDDTGDLTPGGREALAVGDELYGDDKDVASLKETIRVREVANNGPT